MKNIYILFIYIFHIHQSKKQLSNNLVTVTFFASPISKRELISNTSLTNQHLELRTEDNKVGQLTINTYRLI